MRLHLPSEEIFQKQGALNNFLRLNKRNAQHLSKLFRISKGEHFVRAFAVELFAKDAVDVREDQVDGVLREVVKGSSTGYDIPQQRMIILNMRFLVRSIGITEEERGFLVSVQTAFERRGTAEFTAIVREKNRENIAERKAVISQFLLQCSDLRSSFSGGLIFQKKSEHKIDIDKLEGHNDLAADSAYY